MRKVFVYGSLKMGFGNHHVIEEQTYLGDAVLSRDAGLRMVSLGAFPALIPSEAAQDIKGELYEVNDGGLQQLDWLEGYPDFYNRKEVTVGDVDALVYFIDDGNYEPYKSEPNGEWTDIPYGVDEYEDM